MVGNNTDGEGERRVERVPLAYKYPKQTRMILWCCVVAGYFANLWEATVVLGVLGFVLELVLMVKGPPKVP
jgi:hypothetical protein